ncbi:MAG: hypothetical protein E7589_04095 [Ruminococcaceae bacterium]|nr:hypothetical protein [Oscillospiraceae bacterium]
MSVWQATIRVTTYIEETDARGNKTAYTVDGDTSRNSEVIDRCGNKTAYEYDDSGRTTKVTSKDANNNTLAHVSYSYDTFDNMTEIARGDGMTHGNDLRQCRHNNFGRWRQKLYTLFMKFS